jgi:hypothetical protein
METRANPIYTGAEVNATMNSKWTVRRHAAAALIWGAGLIAVGVAWLIHR